MSRNDYDDMGQSFSRRGKGGDKKTYVISFMGVLIILIAIIVYIIFKPVDDGDGAIEEENTSAMELNIPDVEEISVERSDDISSIADDVFLDVTLPDEKVGPSSFCAPSDGIVTHSFNEVYDGKILDGITYSAAAGSAVYAVSDGIVSDAGNSNEYGRYISISHSQSGLRSSYYCLETVLVKPGDKVRRGDIIGSIGTSNKSFETPTLFFKLEKGSSAQDPAIYF